MNGAFLFSQNTEWLKGWNCEMCLCNGITLKNKTGLSYKPAPLCRLPSLKHNILCHRCVTGVFCRRVVEADKHLNSVFAGKQVTDELFCCCCCESLLTPDFILCGAEIYKSFNATFEACRDALKHSCLAEYFLLGICKLQHIRLQHSQLPHLSWAAALDFAAALM